MKFFHGARAALFAAVASSACTWGYATTTSLPFGDVTTFMGKCLAVQGDANARGAPVVHAACGGRDARRMRLEPASDGYYFIVVENSKGCIGVANSSVAADAKIVQDDCTGTASTQWELTSMAPMTPTTPPTPQPWGAHTLKARHSGMCMDVHYYAKNNGAGLVQFPCNGQHNQNFFFEHNAIVPQGPVRIASTMGGQCMGVEHGSEVGTPATAQVCRGEWNQHDRRQQWLMKPYGDGTAQIVSASSGMCLDVHHGSRSATTHVVQFPCQGGDHQRWRVEGVATGFIRLVAVHSGMCLIVDPSRTLQGVPMLTQSPCIDGRSNEIWGLWPELPHGN